MFMALCFKENDGDNFIMSIDFYAICLKSFQARINHGQWIDASLSLEEIESEIDEMLSTSSFENATDWRIHRFESLYNFDFLHDEIDLETLHDMAIFIQYHGHRGGKLLEYFRGDVREATDALERYIGQFNDPVSFVKKFFPTFYKVSPVVKASIDFKGLWERLRLRHYFALPSKNGGVHIFAKDNNKRF